MKFKTFFEAKNKASQLSLDYNYVTGEFDAVRPSLITWIAGNGKEFVAYYNHTGHVMHFTHDYKQAYKTTDFDDAKLWARIANEVYNRTNFSPIGAHQYRMT